MPALDEREMGAVRHIAGSVAALSTTANAFRQALTDLCNVTQGGLVNVARSSTGIDPNFRLETVHGQIEAIFDHAFKGDYVVGRYRFYMLETTANGDVEATEIWTVLFDANYRATWGPDEDYLWTFIPDGYHTASMMGQFVLTLFGKIQARMPRYKAS